MGNRVGGALGLVLLSLVAGAAAMLVGGLTRDSEPPPQPSRGRAVPAEAAPRGRAAREQGFLGVLVAEESVDLTTTLEGRIESIRVRLGDRIRRGEVVATLDSQALQRELAVAEAELAFSRTEEEAATVAHTEAMERLKRRDDPQHLQLGALSEEELATARYQERLASTKLSGARAQVLQREARVRQVRQRLGETSLLAPFDALVASRYVDSGALVSPGKPIVHLLRADGRKVRFAIPEKQTQGLAPGLPVRVSVTGHEGTLTGRIVSLAPEVDAASRMVFGVASLEEPRGAAVPSGSVVRVSVVPPPASEPARGAAQGEAR